jgi:hypothetical protein
VAENMLPKKVLVCALADAELTVAGSTFDRACSQCKARIMVAPSGRAALARDPTMVLACVRCAVKAVSSDPEVSIALAGAPSDIVCEIKSAQPNFWRKRN